MTRCYRKKGMKLIAALMAVMMVFTAVPFMASAESFGAVTTEYVNFRTGPSTDSGIMTVVPSGTSITVLDNSNSQWFRVSVPGVGEGYIFSSYISSTGSGGGSYVTTATVNLRSGRSTDYRVIDIVDEGTTLTVTDTSDSSWYGVRLSNGTTGYIFSQYLSTASGSNPVPNPPSPPAAVSEPYITTATVNLRSGAGMGHSIIGLVDEGTTLTVTDKSNSDWYGVKLSSGSTGYISSQYLQPNGGPATPPPATPPPATVSEQYITTATVNLRSGRSTSTSVVDLVDEGTTLTVTDKSDSSWYAVTLANGTTGYIYTEYLQAVTSNPTPPPPPAISETYVTTATVNVRQGMGTDTNIIALVDEGTNVTVTSTANASWYAVKLASGTSGYISSQYLQKVAATTPTPPPPPAVSESYITTATVNLRSGTSTDTAVITIVDEGTKLTVTDKSNSSWFAVKLADGTVGYISAQYLQKEDVNAKPTPPTPGDSKTYLKVNASSGLNFRDAPGGNLISILNNGEVLIQLAAAAGGWVNVETTSGAKGWVSADYVVPFIPSAASSISVSTTEVSVSKYKTFYVEASANGGSHIIWSSSDTNVATVVNGFIYGVSQGSCTVTAKDAIGTAETKINVMVTNPEAVRFACATPNTPNANVSFGLTAVTDTEKTKVRFDVLGVGSYETTDYSTESATKAGYSDNNVKIFTAYAALNAGTYTVRAYSDSGSGYSSDYYEFTLLVTSAVGTSATSNEERHASDDIVNILANFEGFLQVVEADNLAYGIPTVGYGYVVNKNTTFYNNLTRTEGIVQLKDTVNNGPYTSAVNNLLISEGLYMNQAQFDALVSFSYNVGTGWTYDSTVRSLLLNTVDYNNMNFSSPISASIFLSTAVYQDHGASSTVAELRSGTAINVTDVYTDSNNKLWYKITSSAFSGSAWVRGGNVKFNGSYTRDLNCIDPQIFAYKLLEWHVAGGNCIEGLIYRRNAEAKIFLYGNYAEAYHSNGNYYNNTYGFTYPSCMKEFE